MPVRVSLDGGPVRHLPHGVRPLIPAFKGWHRLPGQSFRDTLDRRGAGQGAAHDDQAGHILPFIAARHVVVVREVHVVRQSAQLAQRLFNILLHDDQNPARHPLPRLPHQQRAQIEQAVHPALRFLRIVLGGFLPQRGQHGLCERLVPHLVDVLVRHRRLHVRHQLDSVLLRPPCPVILIVRQFRRQPGLTACPRHRVRKPAPVLLPDERQQVAAFVAFLRVPDAALCAAQFQLETAFAAPARGVLRRKQLVRRPQQGLRDLVRIGPERGAQLV